MASEQQIAANRLNAQLSSGPKSDIGKKVSRMNALRHGLTGQIDVTTPDEKEAKEKFFHDIISSLAPEGAIEHQFAHSVADGHWRGVINDEPVRPYPRTVRAKRSTCGRRASTIENNIFTLACSFEEAQAEQVRRAAELDGVPNPDETLDPAVDKALGAARVFIADPKHFQLLTIYEGRIHRNMTKNLQQLTELQATRRAAEASRNASRDQALDEARLLTQLAEMESVPCDIATDFPNQNGFVFAPSEIAQTIRRMTRLKAAKHAESSNWNPSIRRAA